MKIKAKRKGGDIVEFFDGETPVAFGYWVNQYEGGRSLRVNFDTPQPARWFNLEKEVIEYLEGGNEDV